jgi:hypothetical protein
MVCWAAWLQHGLAALVVVRHDVVFVLTPDIVVVSFLVTLFLLYRSESLRLERQATSILHDEIVFFFLLCLVLRL